MLPAAFPMEGDVKMRFIKFGKAYLNMDRIEMIRHCAGNVIEAVMTDGKRVYGNKQDLDGLDIVEKNNSHEPSTMVEYNV